MASLLSSWSSNVLSLPVDYIVPVERRPGNPVSISKDIPVIDLTHATKNDRVDIVQQLIKASQDFGLFQVINHGVSEDLMVDAMNVGKEFFGLPAKDKERLCDDSTKFGQKGGKLYTSSGQYSRHEFKYWRDTLQHHFHPLESYISSWPQKPTKYRDIIGEYTNQVRKLGMRIMDMLYEGLGLEVEDIEKEFDKYDCAFSINHYPACPDPGSALGTGRHCDPTLITLLQQDVYGLQLLNDGQWLGVEPLPNAFVVNISLLLEVISNGKLKSDMHRVVTNSVCSRTSLAIFVSYPSDGIIQPAKSLISPTNPPLYRAFQYKDFLEFLFANNAEPEAAMKYLKL
ncbi:hypothetical protein ACH5RR_009433 [Cinchona calisaya]|uniref:Fe2OG dioxygenase domain-containing protein n=1 Tax=Cinchona calisaya TaxID=153742 RepID=A0ABD3AGM0_9GENT